MRIRALEPLGKIQRCGVVCREVLEVTITRQTTDDIKKKKLRGKLAKLIDPADSDVEDAQ